MALCKTTVLKVYNNIIDDVISGVRDIFIDEGIDEQILYELKALWESKLMATKAVDPNAESAIEQPTTTTTANNKTVKKQQQQQQQQQQQDAMVIKRDSQQFIKTEPLQQQTVARMPQTTTTTAINTPATIITTTTSSSSSSTATTTIIPTLPPLQSPDDKLIPIQITLPTQPTADASTRVLTIHVPASALNDSQLPTLLTGPVITATMGLPTPLASSLLQQHVNAALQSQQKQAAAAAAAAAAASVTKVVMPQMDGSGDGSFRHRKRLITDGGADTSDEEEDDASDDDGSDDEIDDDKEDLDGDIDDGAPEEEPLNSEDDVTDEEPTDLFDTDNVVVCQYDKITRCRNKWKFHLKDGIMNLDGEDFVFQKANGDAEW